MRHLNGAHTTYFNVNRKRTGHLFQGRYKAILVKADQYAAELSRYIHLNPVRVGIAETPEGYPWSSYRSYIGQNKPPAWLRTEFILSYFGGKIATAQYAYREFIEELLKCAYDSPLQATVASTLLGNPEFVREISSRHLGGKQDERNVPARRKLVHRPSIDEILQKVQAILNGEKLVRNIGIYCCQKYSGTKLKKTGDRFAISDAAVSQTSRRLVLKAETDQQLKNLINKVEIALGFVKC